jgi:hypothetical protein
MGPNDRDDEDLDSETTPDNGYDPDEAYEAMRDARWERLYPTVTQPVAVDSFCDSDAPDFGDDDLPF